MTVELRCGRWQDVLPGERSVDAVITDSPYSARTASGFRSNPDWKHELGAQPGITYGYITDADIVQCVYSWTKWARRWFIAFADHTTARVWEDVLAGAGWVTFAPLPWIKEDAPPRFIADGPASQTEWVVVARPRTRAFYADRRSRPGWYLAKRGRGPVQGTKDLDAMRRLVRDYTLPGDTVADPYAGWGTTLLAAHLEGRHAIGAECDPETYEAAQRRLAHMPPGDERQPALFEQEARDGE